MSDRLADMMPPQDLQAEQVVIGCCLMDPEAAARAAGILEPASFYREAHRQIYAAIRAVMASHEPLDPVTVANELRRGGHLAACGGAEYLLACMGEVPTTAHVVRYATIVARAAMLRQIIRTAAGWQRAAYDYPDDPAPLLAEMARDVSEMLRGTMGRDGARFAADAADEIFARLDAAMTETPTVSEARTGIYGLDQRMGGLAGHTLIVPRGQEKAGKSMFGLQCLLSSAQAFAKSGGQRCAVAYVLEGRDIWQERALAWLGLFDSGVFLPTSPPTIPERQGYQRAQEEWRALPLYTAFDLREVDEIIADIRRIHTRHQVGLVLIDYAQLIRGGRGRDTEQRSYQANELASLAGEIQAPIIVPSQVTVFEGGKYAKGSRAWDEAASFVFDVERGAKGQSRDEWQAAEDGRLVIHGCRRKAPFGKYSLHFNLRTGRISDGISQEGLL